MLLLDIVSPSSQVLPIYLPLCYEMGTHNSTDLVCLSVCLLFRLSVQNSVAVSFGHISSLMLWKVNEISFTVKVRFYHMCRLQTHLESVLQVVNVNDVLFVIFINSKRNKNTIVIYLLQNTYSFKTCL